MASGCWLLVLGVCAVIGFRADSPAGGSEEVEVLLQQLKLRLEQLERDRGRSQVAFSASLITSTSGTHQGPFTAPNPLVFKKVMTNIGNAYNPDTGVFTAPTKGLYYVRFTGSVGKSGSLNAAVLKNGEVMFGIYNRVGYLSADSNGVTLDLEEGDRLWAVLLSRSSIYDQSRLSTFSGFLVFPV